VLLLWHRGCIASERRAPLLVLLVLLVLLGG
jgi:hypothetical protein